MIASLVLHAWWAWRTHDGTEVARCGALWVMFAGAVLARPIIRMGYKNWYEASRTINGGSFVPTPEEIEEDRQNAIDARCLQIYGPILALLGTVLWAYGDLAGKWVLKFFC